MKRRPEKPGDGDLKYKTKNCYECKLKFDFHDKEICSWGVEFKYLVEGKSNIRCEYFGKEPPKNSSYRYVFWAKKENLFGRSKNYKHYSRQLKLDI